MSVIKHFSGSYKKPHAHEIRMLLTVLNYVKNKFGIPYSEYIDGKDGPISVSTRTNAESKMIMSEMAYAGFTRKLHQKLSIRNGATDELERLDHIDAYMKPIIAELFPDLGQLWGLGKVTQESAVPLSFLVPYAVENSEALRRLGEKFKNGGHIYRYAKNSDASRKQDPRLAVGRMSVGQTESSSLLSFEVRYHVDSDKELNDAYDSVIVGRVMHINSFFVFVGVERDKGNPFFLIMKTTMPRSRFKGLILRKHPKNSYFTSRVMLATDVKKVPRECRTQPAIELPEVTEKQLKLLMNIATNDGCGVLMLDDD